MATHASTQRRIVLERKMNYEKEMSKYRSRVTNKRGKRGGRRKTDVLPKSFFTPEIGWQMLLITAAGLVLMTACTRSAI